MLPVSTTYTVLETHKQIFNKISVTGRYQFQVVLNFKGTTTQHEVTELHEHTSIASLAPQFSTFIPFVFVNAFAVCKLLQQSVVGADAIAAYCVGAPLRLASP